VWFAGISIRIPAREGNVRRNRLSIAAGLIVIGGGITLGCESPMGNDARSLPKVLPQAAAMPGDRLPDLGMAPLKDFSIRKVNGQRWLRYSTTIVNVGSGQFEVRAQRGTTSDS